MTAGWNGYPWSRTTVHSKVRRQIWKGNAFGHNAHSLASNITRLAYRVGGREWLWCFETGVDTSSTESRTTPRLNSLMPRQEILLRQDTKTWTTTCNELHIECSLLSYLVLRQNFYSPCSLWCGEGLAAAKISSPHILTKTPPNLFGPRSKRSHAFPLCCYIAKRNARS